MLTNVIYMEDDAGLAALLKKRLERHDYRVDIASDGRQGLEMLGGNCYSVALVDYKMPSVGGMDVLRRLAELEGPPPVIMLTGEGSEKVAVEAMKHGAADYLVKDAELSFLDLLPIVIEQVRQRDQLLKEREALLSEARESEERYRKLVELSPDGIAVHSDGKFTFVNPAGAAILGAPCCEELVGRDVLDFVHPHYHQVFCERLTILEQSAVELPWLEEKFLRCDGSEVDVEVTALPFLQEGETEYQIVFRDVTERMASEQRLERMAKYDALTALPNRAFFFDRLNQLLLQEQRHKNMFALLFIDLDRFKELNDRLGHYFGDLLLKEVAQRLVSAVRESDTVARLGGDEFVVILSRIRDRNDAAIMAQRILDVIGTPFDVNDTECRLGVSIGISVFPDDGESKEAQLMKADAAMYRSKSVGSNNYQFYS